MNRENWMLLQPIKVGAIWLKNRIVMPPMEERLNRPDGSITRAKIDYYVERAKGGAGVITVGNSRVDDKASISALSQGSVHNDHMIAGLNELAEAIKANGARAFIQIGHGGRQSEPEALCGRQPVAPSVVPSMAGYHAALPKELTIDEIEEIQDAFAEGARRVKQAGFDGVELHGAHGYLICQFLSPYTNRRTDRYGGSLQDRAQFALEIIRKVRKKVGNDFVLGYRMSADELIPGGLTLEDTTKYARMLENASVNYISVSAGIYETIPVMVPAMYLGPANMVHFAEAIKKVVNIPITTAGAHDIHTGEDALRTGKADLVAFGRSLIADPELPNKLATGTIEDIRPCVRANEGCLSRFQKGQTMRCEVNPACGREAEFKIVPAVNKKQVVIVGGGIAGLEAARVAGVRGHKVIILEKTDTLGGHLIEAAVPEFKYKTRELLDWAIRQVEKAGVEVRLNSSATPEMIKDLKPEVLIIAVGSDFIIPPVPGCDKTCVAAAGDILLGKRPVGDRVVVVGAGLIGCETALYLAQELGKRVTIVEMLDDMLIDVEILARLSLIDKLKESGVEIHLGWHLDEIIDNGLFCTDRKWRKHELEADTVVLATGLGAREEGVEKFRGLIPEVYAIGDCVEARKIYNAFEEAWRVALAI